MQKEKKRNAVSYSKTTNTTQLQETKDGDAQVTEVKTKLIENKKRVCQNGIPQILL